MNRKAKLIILRTAALRQDGGIAGGLALPMLTLYLFMKIVYHALGLAGQDLST